MLKGFIVRNFALVALLVVLVIVYGSLFPFHFARPLHGIGPARTLLLSRALPAGRGDVLANILLYIPLGYFCILALRAAPALRLGLTVLLGGTLSIAMELTQYFDPGRVTQASDVYTNVLGTAVGAAAALALGSAHWSRLPRPAWRDPAALVLLGAWAGYNLFPFEPVIDLHKYWSALKPLFLYPELTPYRYFNHAAVWIAVTALVDVLAPDRRGALWYAGFAGFLLGFKILLIGGSISMAEFSGAATGLVWRLALDRWPRWRRISACALLGCSILALRLEPFHFGPRTRDFGWIPFLSFMNGSLGVDSLAFLEKSFLYGSLIWLLQKNGAALLAATLGVAALLFATSWAETYLPGRSAEITDAVMALFIGSVIALVRAGPGGTAQARGTPG